MCRRGKKESSTGILRGERRILGICVVFVERISKIDETKRIDKNLKESLVAKK